ncbi:MAG TPA: hypothetical protein VLR91_06320, partial [Thermodesulfobacteriota bacterium]|nr:hypothetical protein [Thermodesulfobacteriota bacterium]
THYVEEDQTLCHRVAIMDRGRILALDSPGSLIRGLGSGIIRIGFVQPIGESIRRQLKSLGKIRLADSAGKQVHLQVLETDQALKALFALQEKESLPLKALEILEPNLETVFIHLTGRDLRD